jgi:glycosyltransferase involved in cell wall biosynthesis
MKEAKCVKDLKEKRKISVIVPAYNCEDTIEKCIQSLLAQTVWEKYDQEIIVVDDGSRDSTETIVKKYPVRYIKIQHSGSVVAINEGIKASIGDIIFIVDAHAYYANDYLELLVDKLERNPDVGTAIGAMLSWTSNKNSLLDKYWEQERSLKLKNYVPWTGWIFRRNDIEKVGLFKTTDVEFTRRILQLGYHIAYEPKALWWHRQPSTFFEIFKKGFMRGVVSFINLLDKGFDKEEFKHIVIGVMTCSVLFFGLMFLSFIQLISLCVFMYTILFMRAAYFVIKKGETLSRYKCYLFLFPFIKVFLPFLGEAIGVFLSPLFYISKNLRRHIVF